MNPLNKCNLSSDFFNYYAMELLASSGKMNPKYQEVSKIENSLKKPEQYVSSDTLVATLIKCTHSNGKILLIESDPFFRYVHFILFSNLGFSVDIASSIEEVVKKQNVQYTAIFSRINQEKINGWMAARIFEHLPDDVRPKIYLFVGNTEDNIIKEHFLKRGAEGVFELPLNMCELSKKLNKLLAGQKKNGVKV